MTLNVARTPTIKLELFHTVLIPTLLQVKNDKIQLHASNDQNGLFYDHASRFLHFTPHHSTGAEEAIVAKRHFEHLASTHNRTIKRYHADNGVFTTKLFRDACQAQNQNLTFCGVDAHHQNGIAERFIRTITEKV